MPRVTVYIREDDYEKWKLVENKAELVSQAINRSVLSPGENDGTVNATVEPPQDSPTPIYGYNARDERALPNTTVTTSELGELPCCAGARPCKHWVWDTATGEGYRNSLSGRLREAS